MVTAPNFNAFQNKLARACKMARVPHDLTNVAKMINEMPFNLPAPTRQWIPDEERSKRNKWEQFDYVELDRISKRFIDKGDHESANEILKEVNRRHAYEHDKDRD